METLGNKDIYHWVRIGRLRSKNNSRTDLCKHQTFRKSVGTKKWIRQLWSNILSTVHVSGLSDCQEPFKFESAAVESLKSVFLNQKSIENSKFSCFSPRTASILRSYCNSTCFLWQKKISDQIEISELQILVQNKFFLSRVLLPSVI